MITDMMMLSIKRCLFNIKYIVMSFVTAGIFFSTAMSSEDFALSNSLVTWEADFFIFKREGEKKPTEDGEGTTVYTATVII